MAAHNDYGKWGEQKAADFLAAEGYSICHRNWKSGHRDLDIVALSPDGNLLVIVEVKTRANKDVTEPVTAVDRRKSRNLFNAANAYVRSFDVKRGLRFDIITVIGRGDTAQIEHIEDAIRPY
ncbi:MAG: YraN family protein [Prevotella sp.]|nr:YraN family protein [Prevotella sp.]